MARANASFVFGVVLMIWGAVYFILGSIYQVFALIIWSFIHFFTGFSLVLSEVIISSEKRQQRRGVMSDG